MTSTTPMRTPYTDRLDLVTDTITAHSKLKEKDARDVALHVLHALNSIPEKMR